MKATQLLSLLLLLATETVATATADLPRDGRPQLTLSRTWPRLTSQYGSSGQRHDGASPDGLATALNPLEALQHALEVMQSAWFALWVGSWPTGIDWTRAVLNTHLVSSLSTFSKALKISDDVGEYRDVENDLNRYFSQNVAYYFGEDAFALRNQAYDDMLWVVLGWLESIKFIRSHSSRHYCDIDNHQSDSNLRPWQGAQFIEAFSHRARLFYDISSGGWDESFCGGGMVWNPYLGPYKNAITNELFISASIGMYLYFAGDNNTSPFKQEETGGTGYGFGERHDPAYLHAATRGYDWLKNSGMQNDLGLYVDGFHISDWKHGGTKCDIRNEMVFTYNQGVILSGLRGLWEGTGNTTYLHDAHKLVRDVVTATGWDLYAQTPRHKHWSAIGRHGILEERCDAAGECSQDAQTFKGIFFHHLTLLCEPLPLEPLVPGKTFAADKALAHLHLQSCKEYATWTAHNAQAAVRTRDDEGKFGMWWGAHRASEDEDVTTPPLSDGAVDYRNDPMELLDPTWLRGALAEVPQFLCCSGRFRFQGRQASTDSKSKKDPNERGRGRTVETQSGGIAVLRALWELLHLE